MESTVDGAWNVRGPVLAICRIISANRIAMQVAATTIEDRGNCRFGSAGGITADEEIRPIVRAEGDLRRGPASSSALGCRNRAIAANVPPGTVDATMFLLPLAYARAARASLILDGSRVPLSFGNYAFVAVRCPEGRHRIELRFRPVSFRLGVGSCALAIGAALVASRRRRRA